MTDRERWIVYPLLLMALGLALQPKIMPVDARFATVKCERLSCADLDVRRANVLIELDAARAKTRVLSAGTMNAGQASIGAVSSKLVDAEEIVITDALGVRQARLVGTKHGGRLDIDRYSIGGDAPAENRNFETYVIDRRGVRIQLGVANVHLVAPEKPKDEVDEPPQADANDSGGDTPSEPVE